eukprot:COSAG06_NODE_10375_length_1692_cov_13.423729_2_plen_89_part_00
MRDYNYNIGMMGPPPPVIEEVSTPTLTGIDFSCKKGSLTCVGEHQSTSTAPEHQSTSLYTHTHTHTHTHILAHAGTQTTSVGWIQLNS